jgi:hypothetical protein
MTKIAGFDLDEHLNPEEIQIRGLHRARPNILGFSLFYKPASGSNHFSLVENSLWKATGSTWTEWW